MTIVIDAPAEIEAVITRKAEDEGITVQEFALRAVVDRATGNDTIGILSQHGELIESDDREARREAAIDLVKSGYFARTGLSTEALFADRREEVRLEAEQEARQDKTRQERDEAEREGRS